MVVDNQIRWSNLSTLKDEWQAEVRQKRKETGRGRERERERSPPQDDGSAGGHPADKEPSFYRVRQFDQ